MYFHSVFSVSQGVGGKNGCIIQLKLANYTAKTIYIEKISLKSRVKKANWPLSLFVLIYLIEE